MIYLFLFINLFNVFIYLFVWGFLEATCMIRSNSFSKYKFVYKLMSVLH